jgi:hypothetical protein
MRVRFSQSKSALRIIASALLSFAIVGCGHSNIVGKWRMSGSEATVWEFKTNGAVLVGDVNGRYKFGDQDRIKIETPFATSVYQLELSGDHMTLQKPGGGSTLEFTRIKETQR